MPAIRKSTHGGGGERKRARGRGAGKSVQTRRASSPLTPPPEPVPTTPATGRVSHPPAVTSVDAAPTTLDAYRLDLDAGDVLYIPDFATSAEAAEWYDAMHALDTWHRPTLKVYGRPVVQSRAVAAYAASPGTMKYSNTEVPVHAPMPSPLDAIRRRVESRLGQEFSSCMLNLYEHGGVYIGRHSDTRENRTIASLSLGAERTFVLSPRLPPREAGAALSTARKAELEKRQTVRFKWVKREANGTDGRMASGSLVVMQGTTQDYWKHEIPKELRVKDGRISLTFRQLD